MHSGAAKTCPQCEQVKPLDDFKDSTLVTGIGRFCLTCKSGSNKWSYHPLKEKNIESLNGITKNDIDKLLKLPRSKEKCIVRTTTTASHAKETSRLDNFNVLQKGFDNHISVRISYKGSWRTIDPYSLNRTYVVAYCHIAKDIRTFRLDRVQGAVLLENFNVNPSLQGTAQSRIADAPNYKFNGSYRHR